MCQPYLLCQIVHIAYGRMHIYDCLLACLLGRHLLFRSVVTRANPPSDGAVRAGGGAGSGRGRTCAAGPPPNDPGAKAEQSRAVGALPPNGRLRKVRRAHFRVGPELGKRTAAGRRSMRRAWHPRTQRQH